MDLDYYLELLSHRARLDAFRRAIGAVVRPGERVVEVGAGLGTFSLFAAAAGAGEVMAIEREPIIDLAEELARRNGLSGKIRFLRGDLHDTVIEPRADLVIFENLPPLALGVEIQDDLAAIRERVLAPGGRLIPARVEVRFAPVDATVLGSPFAEGSAIAGIDFSPVVERAESLPRAPRGEPAPTLGEPALGAAFDLATDPVPRRVEATLAVGTAGTLGAILGWIDLELAPGIRVEHAPTGPTAWGRLAFPVGPAPVTAGDCIRFVLDWSRYGQATVWEWQATVEGPAGVRCGWRRSSFASFPEAAASFARHGPDHRPVLNPEGRLLAEVLPLLDGRTSFGDVARRLHERHPARFRTPDDALRWLGQVALRFASR